MKSCTLTGRQKGLYHNCSAESENQFSLRQLLRKRPCKNGPAATMRCNSLQLQYCMHFNQITVPRQRRVLPSIIAEDTNVTSDNVLFFFAQVVFPQFPLTAPFRSPALFRFPLRFLKILAHYLGIAPVIST